MFECCSGGDDGYRKRKEGRRRFFVYIAASIDSCTVQGLFLEYCIPQRILYETGR